VCKGQTATREAFSHAHASNALSSHSLTSWDTKHSLSHTRAPLSSHSLTSNVPPSRAYARTRVQDVRLTFCGASLPCGFSLRVTSDFLVSAPLPLSLALSRVRSLCARARALFCLLFLLPVPSCAGSKQRRQDLPKRLLRAHPLARAVPLPLLMYHDEAKERRGAAVSCMKAGDVRGVGVLKPEGAARERERWRSLVSRCLPEHYKAASVVRRACAACLDCESCVRVSSHLVCAGIYLRKCGISFCV
jgi:hypothetical protein